MWLAPHQHRHRINYLINARAGSPHIVASQSDILVGRTVFTSRDLYILRISALERVYDIYIMYNYYKTARDLHFSNSIFVYLIKKKTS